MTEQWKQLADQSDSVGAPLEITEYIGLPGGVLVRTSVRSSDNYTWSTALEFIPMGEDHYRAFMNDRGAESGDE